MKKTIIFLVYFVQIFANDPIEERFTEIYTKRLWGGANPSGGGSLPENLESYLTFLRQLLATHQISSILDLGCGDFSYFKTIDLNNIHYRGIDIVKELVDFNQLSFGKDNITFTHGNILDCELPHADLVICKHILQHLSNDDVFKVLSKLGNYRYCILLDQMKSDMPPNSNITSGQGRPLDLEKSPFNLKPTWRMTFKVENYLHKLLFFEKQ